MIENLNESQLIRRYPSLEPIQDSILCAINLLIASFDSGGKLLICGNGGSAADSDHICGELMKGFLNKRPLDEASCNLFNEQDRHIALKLQGALPCINLTSSSGLISAFGNDVDWRYALAQQVWGLGQPNDVLLAISTSGNSANVNYAVQTAKSKGMRTLGMTGMELSTLSDTVDVCIKAPETQVHVVQELHLPIYHAICIELENYYFSPQITERSQ